jgi:transcriptional regulator with XRE-family HTH domain
MHTQTIKYPNHLYRLRRLRGFSQKHIAHLLGHRSVRMVSRYETGVALPPLKTALLLEIALGAHVSDIYPATFRDLKHLATTRASLLTPALGQRLRDRLAERSFDGHTNT